MPHSSGAHQGRETTATGTRGSQEAERNLCPFYTQSKIPCLWNIRPTIKIGLSTSINVIKIIPQSILRG